MQAELNRNQKSVIIPSVSLPVDLFFIIVASLLIALSAQLTIRLPFSPVPFTGQTLAILLVSATLGSWRGTLAVGAYILQGLIGLPVFANGGAGIGHLLGPTGGYLLGFVAMAWVVGKLAERGRDRERAKAWLAFLFGEIVLYIIGLIWLSTFVGIQNAITLGLLPFIPGDILKIILAGQILPTAWQLTKKNAYDQFSNT
jgi:biotin transport system substrate-specific component